MLRRISCCLLLFVSALAFATPAKITLNTNVQQFTGDVPSSRIRVQVDLIQCAPNLPRVVGIAVFGDSSRSIAPDGSGNVSTLLWPNDVITCDTIGNSRYQVSIVKDQKTIWSAVYNIVSSPSTQDLSSLTPVAVTVVSPYLSGHSLLHGTVAPTSGDGNDADFFLNTTSNCLYGPKASGAWPGSCVSIVGPAGSPGTSGPTGPSGTVSSASMIQNVVQASNWTNLQASISANGSSTQFNMDTKNYAGYNDTTVSMPAGAGLSADRGAYFSNSSGAAITWHDPYTWTETGVIFPAFPLCDIRRYGVLPDGTTNWATAHSTYITNALTNSQSCPRGLTVPAGYYATGLNCTLATCSGSHNHFEPGSIFDGIMHVIPTGGTINTCSVSGMTRSSNVVSATFSGTCGLVNGNKVFVMKVPDASFNTPAGDWTGFTLSSVTGSSPSVTAATWPQTGPNQATSQIYGTVVDPPIHDMVWDGEITTLDRFGMIDTWNSYFQFVHVANDPSNHAGGGKARGVHMEGGLQDVTVDNMVIDDSGGTGASANTDACGAFDGDDVNVSIGTLLVHSCDTHGVTLAGTGYRFGDVKIERACTVGWGNNTPGLIFNPLWTWNSGTTYHAATHDLVLLSGTYYYSILDSTNQTPPNATYWTAISGSAGVASNVMNASECKYLWVRRAWSGSIDRLWIGKNYVAGDNVKYMAMLDENGYGNNANANRLFKINTAIVENIVGGGINFGDRNVQPANYDYQIGRLNAIASTGATLTSGFGLVNVNTPLAASPSTSTNAHVSIDTLQVDGLTGNQSLIQQTGTNLKVGYLFNTFGTDTVAGPVLDLEGMFAIDRVELGSLAQSASTTPMILLSGSGVGGSNLESAYVWYTNSGGNSKPGMKITGASGLTIGKYSSKYISGDSNTAGSLWIDASSGIEITKVAVDCGTNTGGNAVMFTNAITTVNILSGKGSNCRWGVLGNSATFTDSNVYNFTFAGTGSGGTTDIVANKSGLTPVSAPGFTLATHATNFPTGTMGINDVTPGAGASDPVVFRTTTLANTPACTSADVNVYSTSVAANTFTAGQGFIATIYGSHTTGTQSTAWKMYVDATLIGTYTPSAASAAVVEDNVRYWNNQASATAGVAYNMESFFGSTTTGPAWNGNKSIDWTLSHNIIFAVNCTTNTDTFTFYGMTVYRN